MSVPEEPDLMRAEGGVITVTGCLDVDSVALYRVAGEQLLEEMDEAVFDLSAAVVKGSAVIALLIAWQRAALAAEKSLRIRNAPENLLAIAEACGVREILPFE